jgi:hypothetical protein
MENMGLHIHIEKRYFYVIATLIVLLIGALLVIAFNPSFNKAASEAATFGHSADETVVRFSDGTLETVQNILTDKPLKIYECSLSADELKNKGCPLGTSLYKIVSVCPSSGSCSVAVGSGGFCRWEMYTNIEQAPQKPTCYQAASGGGSGVIPDLEQCGKWVEEPFPHRVYCY